jgi:hypothetical protein
VDVVAAGTPHLALGPMTLVFLNKINRWQINR